jgi:flagellar motor switch protein FliG
MRTTLAFLSFLSSGPALAAAVTPPSGVSPELLTNETRRRVTEEVKKFLEERCPQQCDVGEVTVKVDPRRPPVGATPGFEELAPDSKDYLVSRVDVNLMLDKRLTNDFRSGLRTIVGKKLEAEGMNNVVHESLIHFPTPQEIPDHPPVAPQAPQANAGKDKPEEKKVDPAAPIAPPAERTWWDRLIDSLPLLLGLILCAMVVWFTLRQYQKILEARTDVRKERELAEAREAAKDDPKLAEAEARRELDRTVAAMRARLDGNRPLARAVMRDLLARGAVADTALAVVMLGPSVLDGVRGDSECRAGLGALDDFLAERAPTDGAEARKRVLADLDRRILRVQVAQGEHPEESPFSYLRDASAPLFARLLTDEEPEAQAIILQQAPPPLVQQFLDAQPPSAREQLVRPLLASATASRERIAELAASFREKLDRHQMVERGDGHSDPVGDLLQSASPEERTRLLGSLRNDPPALRRALGSFVDDETLRALDREVLASAMTRLDATTAALFAGSMDEVARKRLLAALPESLGRSIAEEAEVLAASPARRAAARRTALLAVRRAIDDRGLDLAEINGRAQSSRKEAAS